MDKAKEDIRNGVPIKDVFLQSNDFRNPQNSIKDPKTLHNLKARLPENKEKKTGNLADGFVHMETMKVLDGLKAKYDQFVQNTNYDKQRNASVVLYKEWMIQNLVRNCAVEEKSGLPCSVLAMDTTFNVGQVLEIYSSFDHPKSGNEIGP